MEKQKEFTREEIAKYFSASKEVKVVFTKKDGSIRTLVCTTDHDTIPEKHQVKTKTDKSKKKMPEHTFAVFDLKADGWRSFTIANVISIEGV